MHDMSLRVRLAAAAALVVFALASGAAAAHELTKNGTVITYDRRSLMIDGRREIFFSGSIHYPRSPPDMWPDLIAKAKEGGLNVIETYVFWNIHEPEKDVYNFEGRYDLVKFFKLIQEQELYAMVRIGPFIQAEWNHGGLPYWLREVPGIVFRTNNEPFKMHMEKFVNLIVKKLKDANLFASQGGPVILSQIENEYQHLEVAFKEEGTKYIEWAAKMAIKTGTGVPWIMCKQTKAPGEVIPTCNGRHCGDTWPGPANKTKPLLWTENWTAQYRVFGDPPSQRSAEDIAFAVARFFSVGGTMTNYYMYHGGTNFGRGGAAFVMPRYYDEAPLDEFGLYKEPKWGHLKDLHQALRLCKKALLWGTPSTQPLGKLLEARVFEIPEQKVCVAFLSNHDTKIDSTVAFRGQQYFVPRHSVSILADCKTVVYSTQHVNAQHNQRTFHFADQTVQNNVWEMYTEEKIPRYKEAKIRMQKPQEMYNLTKDKTDYLWYTTGFRLEADDLPFRSDIRPVLEVSSHGHAMVAFVNDVFVGCGHGTKMNKAFMLQKPMELKKGVNRIAILANTLGMMDSGAFLEHRQAGVQSVQVQGLNTGTLDLTPNGWGHVVGLVGEEKQVYTEKGMSSVSWKPAVVDRPLTWYKRYFDMPSGENPVVIDMSPMGKGVMFVNGEGIGRYWSSYKHALGRPSQHLYHVPRSLLREKKNVLVLFEEEGGRPDAIMILTVKRDNICTFISENNPAHIRSWERKDSQLSAVAGDLNPRAVLSCPPKKAIQQVVFASYGNPLGICGNYTVGSCHTPRAKEVVEKACIGKRSCVLAVSHEVYGGDLNCPGTTATLAVQAKCSKRPPSAAQ
ncbi:beta-galactosidase 11-like [Phragmites australis]|uniref:beta-galactosidase 11-like n=1 Tax=Phragmites australis TaxID=29695 RepID=UPI002D799685|nr:beta-galactosidase 11-like [Phragmites australis]